MAKSRLGDALNKINTDYSSSFAGKADNSISSIKQDISDYDLNSIQYDEYRAKVSPDAQLKDKGFNEKEVADIKTDVGKKQESTDFWNRFKSTLTSVISNIPGLDVANKVSPQSFQYQAPTPKSYDELIEESSQAYIQNKGVANLLSKQDKVKDFSTGLEFNTADVLKNLDKANGFQKLFGLTSDKLGNKKFSINEENVAKLFTGDDNFKLDNKLSDEGNFDKNRIFYSYKDKDGQYKVGMADFKDAKQVVKIGGSVISAYGPKSFKKGLGQAFKDQFIQTIGSTPKMIANFEESVVDLIEGTSNLVRGKGFKSTDNKFTDKISKYYNDLDEINKIESSNNADASSFGAESLAGGIGSGLGSLAQFAGLGAGVRVGAEGLGLGEALASRLGTEAGKDAFNQIIQFGAGSILNHGEAYDSARQVGLSDANKALFALTVGSVNSFVESKFGSNAMFDYLSGGGDRTIVRTILNDINKELGNDLSKVTTKQLAKAISNTSKGFFSKINGSIADYLAKPVLGSALEEGSEEFMQTLVSKASENLYDMGFGSDNVGEGKFGTKLFSKGTIVEALQSAVIGGLVGALGDTPRGITQKLSGINKHRSEAGVLPHIVDGNTDKVVATINKLYDEGIVTESAKDAYLERVNNLDKVWNNNSTSFSNLNKYNNATDLKSEALGIINGVFTLKNDIQSIGKTISSVQSDSSLSDIEKRARVEQEQAKIEDKQLNIDFFNSLLQDYSNTEGTDTVKAGEERFTNRSEVINNRFKQFTINSKVEKATKELENIASDIEVTQGNNDFLINSEGEVDSALVQENNRKISNLKARENTLKNVVNTLNNLSTSLKEEYTKITSKDYQATLEEETNETPDPVLEAPIGQPVNVNTDAVIDNNNIPNPTNLSDRDKLQQEITELEKELESEDLDSEAIDQLTQIKNDLSQQLTALDTNLRTNEEDDNKLIQATASQIPALYTDMSITPEAKLQTVKSLLNDLNTRIAGNNAKGIKDNTKFAETINALKQAQSDLQDEIKENAKQAEVVKNTEKAKKEVEAKTIGLEQTNVFQHANFFTTMYPIPTRNDVRDTTTWTDTEIQDILASNTPESLLEGLNISFRPIENLGLTSGTISSDTKNPNTKLLYPKLNAVVNYQGKSLGLLPESTKLGIQTKSGNIKLIDWNLIDEVTFRKYLSSTADFNLTVNTVQNLMKLEALSKGDNVYSRPDLVKLGVTLNITNAGFNVNNSPLRDSLGSLDAAKLKANGSKIYVYDKTKKVVYNEGTEDMISLDNVPDPETIGVNDRYLVLTQLSNGDYRWITSQPSILTDEQKIDLFNEIKSAITSLTGSNDSVSFIRTNNSINSKLFITGNPGQYFEIEVTDKGKVRLKVKDGAGTKSYLLNEKAKTFDGLFNKGKFDTKAVKFRSSLSSNPTEQELLSKMNVNVNPNILSNYELKISFDSDALDKALLDTTPRAESSNKPAPIVNTEEVSNPFAGYEATNNPDLEQEQSSDKINTVKSVYSKFGSLPIEAQQEILNRVNDELITGLLDTNKLKAARAKAQLNNIINGVISNPNYNISDNDVLNFFIEQDERGYQGDILDYEDAKTWISENLPNFIEVQDLDNLTKNFINQGTTWGAFKDSIIYLNKNAGEGVQYHEAFHAVYRLLLDDRQINVTLNAAKNKFGKPTDKQIEDLRNMSSAYSLLTKQELNDLWLEEKLANDFKEYKLDRNSKSIFKKTWDKIINLFRGIIGNEDLLNSLYYSIDNSKYKNASIQNNRFRLTQDPAFDIFLTDETGENTTTVKEGKAIINTLAAKLFKYNQTRVVDDKTTNEQILDKLIKEQAELYSIENPFFDGYFNNILSEKLLDAEIKRLEELQFLYTNPSNITKMKEVVNTMYKIFTNEDIENDDSFENEVNEIGERWAIDTFSLGGMTSLSKAMREYMAFTLVESTDIYGRPVERAIDSLVVYRGLTRALAGLSEDRMLIRFKNHSEFNSEAKSFFDKLVKDTGLGDNLNISTARNQDLLRKFINAFKNENVGWYTVLHDSVNKKSRVIESNRNSAKQLQFNEWSNRFLSLGGDDLNNKENKARFNQALTNIKLASNKANVNIDENTLKAITSNIVTNLKGLGIDLSQGYVRYSLLKKQMGLGLVLTDKNQELLNAYSGIKGIFDDNSIDLTEITSQLNKGNNPFIKAKETVNGKDVETGAVTRIESFAEANAIFDETVGESTFQNADGKNVYSILKSSYGLTKLRLLKDSEYRKTITSEFNHLLNHPYADEIFASINPSMFDGYRGTNLSDDKTIKSDKDGSTFGKFSGKEYLQSELALFLQRRVLRANENVDGKIVSNKIGQAAFFNINQMEASNTAYLVNLPIEQYYKDGKITDKALDTLFNYFTEEFLRMVEVTTDLSNPNREIFKGYNDSVKTDKEGNKIYPKGTKFFEFNTYSFAKDLEDKVAKNEWNTREEALEYLNSSKEEYKKLIKDKLVEDITQFKNTLDINGIDYLYNTQKEFNKVLKEEDKSKIVADYYLNAYINTLGINNILIPNPAKSLKLGSVDWYKRAKGIIGQGNDLGSGETRIAVYKEPAAYLDSNLNRTDNTSADKVDVADAQSYITLQHRILEVDRWGRNNAKVKNIYDKILAGKQISFKETKVLADNGAALNSVKTVIYDGEHYFKLSEFILTPGLVGEKDNNGDTIMTTIEDASGNMVQFPEKPLKGMEYLYNKYKAMVIQGVDQVMPESASKMTTLNPAKFDDKGNFDFSKSIMPVDNQFKRLQVETPTGKTKIVHGTQLVQLISSEQQDDLPIDFIYNKDIKTLGDLRVYYRQLMADNRLESFNQALDYMLDENNEYDLKKITNKFYNTVKESGANDVLNNFFKPDNSGNRQFNWNLGPIINKAEQLFLAHFSKGVLSQKVPGLKVSLVSDVGIYKPDGERLQHMVKDADGNYYSECMLPAFAEDLINKNPNDIQDVLKMFGIRIPTQDKHSMISLKVVGFLPTEYGSIGVFPYELVKLSGADFDIDSLYIHRPDYYNKDGKLIPYGKYADTDEKKFEEWKMYELSHNHELRDKINELKDAKLDEDEVVDLNAVLNLMMNGAKDIVSNAFKELGLPTTVQEFVDTKTVNIPANNNAMLEAEIKFLTNDYVRNGAAKVPATMDSIEKSNEIIAEVRPSDVYNSTPNTPIERFKANRNNTEGKNGIGPVALMNNLHAFLSIHDVKLMSSGIELDGNRPTGFGGFRTMDDSTRKNDEISSLLSAMTDNAKVQLAAKLNLTFDPGNPAAVNTLGLATYMLSLGYNMNQTMFFVNQPVIYNMTKGDGRLFDEIESILMDEHEKQTKGVENAPNFEKWLNKFQEGYSTEELKNFIGSLSEQDTLKTSEKALNKLDIEDLIAQYKIKDNFDTMLRDSEFTSVVSRLLSLNKGLDSTFIDNRKFGQALDRIDFNGFLATTRNTDYKLALQDWVNKGLIVKEGDKYVRGANYPQSPAKLKKMPFDPKLAILNDPNTLQNILIQDKVLRDTSKRFFLSQTDMFNNVLSSFTRNDSHAVRYFRSYMMSKSYQKYLMDNKPEKFEQLKQIYSNSGNMLKVDDNNLGKRLIKIKANADYRDNPLIRILNVDTSNNNSRLVDIKFPTRIKADSDYYQSLVKGYEQLFRNERTRQFAIDLFYYTYFKDGLEFKNNSFINAVGPWMFNDVSRGLDAVNLELADKSFGLESVIGNEIDLVKDFIKIFTSDINNIDIVRKLPITNLGKAANYSKEGIEGSIFNNTSEDVNVLSDKDALNAEKLNPKSNIVSNMKAFDNMFMKSNSLDNTNFNFPVSFATPITPEEYEVGMRVPKYYVLESFSQLADDNSVIEYNSDEIARMIIVGRNDLISGFKFKYTQIQSVGDPLLTSAIASYKFSRDIRLGKKEAVKAETKPTENLQNTENNSTFVEAKSGLSLFSGNTEEQDQEAKDNALYEEVLDSPFEDYDVTGDPIGDYTDDFIDDAGQPLC